MGSFGFTPQLRSSLSLFLNTSFLFLLVLFFVYSNSPNKSKNSIALFSQPQTKSVSCSGVHNYTDFNSKCLYVKSHNSCLGNGFINYLEIFYCNFGQFPAVGYALLLLWLIILFYIVGNTSAEYFCPSVEGLCTLLKLSPTIAGTTLLPFGNGANDVFASIISFTRSQDGDVGISSVLGGDFFISCFVVGIVAISVSSRQNSVNEASFFRDVLFLVFSLTALVTIFVFGRINLWGAISFLSIYFVYIAVVSAMHFFCDRKEMAETPPTISPTSMSFLAHCYDEFGEMGTPLIGCVDEQKTALLLRKDASEVSNQKPRIGPSFSSFAIFCRYLQLLLYVLEFPLDLPRRITIPVVGEKKWSKPFAVSSSILAPILLAAVWNAQIFKNMPSSQNSLAIYMTAILVGIILGYLASALTTKSSPPKKCLLPWLAGGFLMSITWTYLIVEELVSLLVSFGNIFGISPSLLGVTVLAWGNSIGDLISNVTMALNGGNDGVQIAMSGCYAGPLFNTVIGLGFSLVLSSWSEYPSPYEIPRDPNLYETVGFLVAGLLWALVILRKRNMNLDRFLGGGLLAIYLCFLFLRLAKALGLPY